MHYFSLLVDVKKCIFSIFWCRLKFCPVSETCCHHCPRNFVEGLIPCCAIFHMRSRLSALRRFGLFAVISINSAVTRAAGVNRPRSPWSQLSLAYCHPGQELASSLNIEAGHQVNVEEDRDAGDEWDPGNLMWVILARDTIIWILTP